MVTKRDLVNTARVIQNTINNIIQNSDAYLSEAVAAHMKKFPGEDRQGSQKFFLFALNRQNNRLRELGLYFEALVHASQNMLNAETLGPIRQNADTAKEGVKDMLKTTLPESYRYEHLETLAIEFENLKKFVHELSLLEITKIKEFKQSVQQFTDKGIIPQSYRASGWIEKATDIWEALRGEYVLIAQRFEGKYYATVKDIKNSRVYSNSTPYATIMEAMNAATTAMAKLAHEAVASQSQVNLPYNPNWYGNQGRLF